jgi:predicted phosphate transport protein (TIGR00153 family)
MKKLTEIFEHLRKKSPEELEKLVKELSDLEHEADLTKNDIRSHLPKSLFLPMDRSQFLEILSMQDSIADKGEDIGHLLILYPIDELGDLCDHIDQLFKKNMEAFWDTSSIIKELHELLESSFGGIEAEKVKTIAEKTSKLEYQADKMKHDLMKEFFKTADQVKTPVFYLYTRLVEEINHISHLSEKLANRIRMILELK